MTVNLVLEYQGFITLLGRARHKLRTWFGSYCNHDSFRIAFLAAREWDGMTDFERKPFIELHAELDISTNAFTSYPLHNRYKEKEHDSDGNYKSQEQALDLGLANSNSQEWRSTREEQKLQFLSMKTHEQGIKNVLEKRDALHGRYEPKKLCILEFILRTKPRWPASSRMWFYRNECHSLSSQIANNKWQHLTEDERGIYERCALIDRKRYDFEKNAWITRMMGIDFEDDNFTLSDFSISDVRSRLDSLENIVEISKELPSLVNLRRPRNPFSLFIEAYRYQIRDVRPEFQFARHLRECSDAWSKLSDEERDFYKEESRKLKEKRKHLLANEPRADSRLTIPINIFNPSRSIYGPCRPAHLYLKLPTPMSLWAEEIKIGTSNRSKMWKNLPESVQDVYVERRDRLRQTMANQKREIDRRHMYVKQLIREAVKLEDFKKELHLIRSSKKTV